METPSSQEKTVALRMIGGKTYIDARITGVEAVLRNSIINVSPALAEDLLALVYVDHRGNECHYFEIYEDEGLSSAVVASRQPAKRGAIRRTGSVRV